MNIDDILAQPLDLRGEAKKYTKQNVSIIPVGKNKIPLVPWKEFCERIATDEEIDAWFDKFPNAQIGAVTGKISKMTVVDVEAEGGEKMWNLLPQTGPISQTGGGGRHYFFLYEPNIKNAVRILDNVDIRGENGYVVFPPSVSDKGSYTWLQQTPMGPFPRKLFNVAEPIVTKSEIDVDVSKLQDIFLKTKVLQFEGSNEGGRNDLMTKFIGIILSEVHPARWDKDAWPAIWVANKKNSPPLSDYELDKSYQSVKQSEIANNPTRWKEQEKSWTPLPDEQKEFISMQEATIKFKRDLSVFYPLGVKLFDKEIRGGCHPGDLISIGGLPGTGKTTWSMNLAKHFVQNGFKTLFLSYEMQPEDILEKFARMGLEPTDLLQLSGREDIPGEISWFEKVTQNIVESLGIKIAIIDNLDFLEGKGNDKTSDTYTLKLKNIVKDLKRIAKKEKMVIILLAHVRKQAQGAKHDSELDMNAIANTAGVAQLSDLVFMIHRKKERGENAKEIYTGETFIAMAKNRWGEKNPKGKFSMLQGQFVWDEQYTMGVEEAAVPSPTAGMTPEQAKEFFAIGKQRLRDDLLEDKASDMYATPQG